FLVIGQSVFVENVLWHTVPYIGGIAHITQVFYPYLTGIKARSHQVSESRKEDSTGFVLWFYLFGIGNIFHYHFSLFIRAGKELFVIPQIALSVEPHQSASHRSLVLGNIFYYKFYKLGYSCFGSR